MYYFGGFYFDLDVFLAFGLEDLLDFGCVFSFEELTINVFLRQEYGMDWEIGSYAVGAAPGHPVLHAVIKICVKGQKENLLNSGQQNLFLCHTRLLVFAFGMAY